MSQPPGSHIPPEHQQFAPSYSTPGQTAPGGTPVVGGGAMPPNGHMPPGGPVPPGPPMPPAAPKKRSWFARHKILTALLAVVVLVIAISALNGGSDPAPDTAPAASQEADGGAGGGESDPEPADQATDAAETEPVEATDAAETEPVEATEPVAATEPAEDTAPDASPAGRDNSSAELTTLGAGSFTVGEDVPPGRYVIEPGAGQTGNLSASSAEDPLAINEILGGDAGFGVPSVTATLTDGEEISISGLSEVTFTPAETVLRSTLSTGDWIVGLDIAAGDYVATPADGETGNFVVYGDFGLPETNEILGDADGFGVPNVTVSLVDGDRIDISGISEVTFTEK